MRKLREVDSGVKESAGIDMEVVIYWGYVLNTLLFVLELCCSGFL
jgi:hypothetical protein